MLKTELTLFIPMIAKALFVSHLGILITLAYLHIAFLMFVVSQTGGLYKGSSTYETLLFFIIIDMSAYFSLLLPYSWTYWILILPGLARILFPLAAPYARSLFVNCPTEVMLFILGTTVPIGFMLLTRIPVVCPNFEFLDFITVGSSFFAGLLFLLEKSRRQKAIYLFMTQTALCARLILGPYAVQTQLNGVLLGLVALVNTAIWLYWIDSSKIRFFNIAFGVITLFLLVYHP